ncbi:MAG TPA: hypothetical protein ENK72_02700 [Epsilonproteobacteria bacterium]|nr:hypothetical protein [Campylobacterota bacterium]
MALETLETLTREELLTRQEENTTQKAALLKEYKSYAADLEYAENDFEQELIQNKRDTLAKKIKALARELEEIETLLKTPASERN